MRLEVREYPVGDIEFGSKTCLDGTRLVVNLADLETLAKQETALAGIEVAIARPGEAVRIIHVLDAVEGICKVEGPSTVYPGFLGPPITAGRGITNKLTGMLIMSTTEFLQPMPGGLAFREGVIDMMGPGQPYCQASHQPGDSLPARDGGQQPGAGRCGPANHFANRPISRLDHPGPFPR